MRTRGLVVAAVVAWGCASLAAPQERPRPVASHVARVASVAQPAVTASPASPVSPRQFVEQHCLACHNDRARAAGLSLADAPADVTADAALWEKVRHKVRSGQMPPAGRPRPNAAETRAVVAAIEETLDRHADQHPEVARVGAHRLNRTEYASVVRDVLGLEVDAAALLLPDEADDGFDNIAASLALSPAHLERYLAAARQISRLAVGDRTLVEAPASSIYTLPKLLEQDVRLGDDLPFGSRGGLAVRHFFPVAGDYVFKVRLRRQVYDYIIGMGHPQALDVRVGGVRVQRFTVGGKATGMPGPLTWNGEIVGETPYELYMHAADSGLEVRTRVAAGTHVVSASFVDTPWEVEGVQQPLPVDFARGADEMYEGLAAVDALTVTGPFVAVADTAAVGTTSAPVGSDPNGTRSVPVGTVPDGTRSVPGGTVPDGTESVPRATRATRATRAQPQLPGTVPILGGGRLSETASRRAIFICSPPTTATVAAARACARRILTHVATRAYRRPATAADVNTLLAFYDTGRATGGFEAGIQSALERMLVSFNFLFRIERAPMAATAARAATTRTATTQATDAAAVTRTGTGTPSRAGSASQATTYRLSALDLASRLSFFLWNSVPDDALRDLAVKGQLHDRGTLERQVRRMLADPRAQALTSSFAAQWLTLRKARTWLPDPNMFPEFDENLRRAFIGETTHFLDEARRSNRSILDLIRADYSFLNARLAEHYGVPGVTGDRFRQVRFTDGQRGGLLGHGSLLMVTSYPDRTAPVVRGAWLLENLLGMPPPPPPPNIPPLESTDDAGQPRSMRAQMERHRQNPACATCHVRMDPLGFSLEHFDAIGRWRARDAAGPIDARATFADGTPIDGAAGLRRFVLLHGDDYVETFVSKMLTYALGRHVDYRDMPAIRRIVREAAPGDFRWADIILGIVTSRPFQMGSSAS